MPLVQHTVGPLALAHPLNIRPKGLIAHHYHITGLRRLLQSHPGRWQALILQHTNTITCKTYLEYHYCMLPYSYTREEDMPLRKTVCACQCHHLMFLTAACTYGPSMSSKRMGMQQQMPAGMCLLLRRLVQGLMRIRLERTWHTERTSVPTNLAISWGQWPTRVGGQTISDGFLGAPLCFCSAWHAATSALKYQHLNNAAQQICMMVF